MTFAGRIVRVPRPFDPARGAEAVAALGGMDPALRDLVHGTAACSPFLKGLIEREADWLRGALAGSPEDSFAALLSDARALGTADLKTGLRAIKRRVALVTALADIGGLWSLETVTRALTDFADLAVARAMTAEIGTLVARGKLPGVTEDDLAGCGGLVALAMGKMGAFELNYSSDIDLIVLFDETRFAEDDYIEARAGFIRATRNAAAALSDMTDEGYVFRTDLRLRPDPSVTPVAMSMDAAERYYEGLGRTWERAAYIKARPAAGDIAAGEAFLDRLQPFVWRKHLDYAAIQDAHDMRLRIREHKGLHSAEALPGRNLKLAPGGIREIEFFTQTRQIIAGGRDPDLRLRGTVEALAALARKGWVTGDEARVLTEDYRAHREVEHRIQMIADQQTHEIPASSEGFARLAAFMGQDPDAFARDLTERIRRVSRIAEGFFAPSKPSAEPELSEAAREIVRRWQSYPALRSERARAVFDRLRPDLLRKVASTTRPEETAAHLDGFLAGLPAGVQLFSLFEANPQLVDLIVDIASTAPGLAAYLSRNAQVFDAVIGGDFFTSWPGRDTLTRDLSRRLAAIGDYERQLDAARRWQKEWHFRIGVHHLRGLIDAESAATEYAELADAVLAALYDAVVADFSRKHGSLPGNGAVVLGMGSLGGERLSATSDLDLIVIYDAAGAETSEGRRPLASRAYYARLTQSLVTALTAPMAEGRLYETDMRLRPSGRQGPVATSIESFETYQAEEAWTWEHLALTHARPVAGSASLAARVEDYRRDLLSRPRDRAKVLADVAEMRARLAEAKPSHGLWDVRQGPGRLNDIALLAEAGTLLAGSPERRIDAQLPIAAGALGLTEAEAAALGRANTLMWRVQAAARLMTAGTLDPDEIGIEGRALLLQETGLGDIGDLEDRLGELAEKAAAIIDRVMEEDGDGT